MKRLTVLESRRSSHKGSSWLFGLPDQAGPGPLPLRFESFNCKTHSVPTAPAELMPQKTESHPLTSTGSRNCHHIATPKIQHHPNFMNPHQNYPNLTPTNLPIHAHFIPFYSIAGLSHRSFLLRSSLST